jgi:hypothetical protein
MLHIIQAQNVQLMSCALGASSLIQSINNESKD